MINFRIIGVALSLALGVGIGAVNAQHSHHDHQPPSTSKPTATTSNGDPYLLSTDAVTGKPLGDKPVIYQDEGRELRFADQESLATFKADPAKYLPAVDRQMIQQQLPHYPLGVCLVTGEKLGSMGEPINHLHRNRLVRFCCAGCVDGFEKDSAKNLAKLDAAVIEKQKPHYPTDRCIVSGDKLGGDVGEPVDHVVGNRLVRLCCKGCIREFVKSPAAYLAKLDASVQPKDEGDKGQQHHDGKDGGAHGDGHTGHRH